MRAIFEIRPIADFVFYYRFYRKNAPMKKPDFFILGAPKCGTTSMDEWLRSHPRIYLAEKECHYFDTTHKNRKVTDLDGYHGLFAEADAQLSVGETSVHYLRSTDAVANILNYNPDAQFIVMLRNPVDMARSWHNHIYRNDLENVRDFETAWHLQEKRAAGAGIPNRCREVDMLYYGKVCSLGEQLQKLYAQVSPERVHLVFFDDLKENPARTYRSVLDFLGVSDDNRQEFNPHNLAQTWRLHWLNDLLSGLGKLKTKMGMRKGLGVLNYLAAKNSMLKPPLPLSSHMHQILTQYFKDDIDLLSRLTGRNLNHWTE